MIISYYYLNSKNNSRKKLFTSVVLGVSVKASDREEFRGWTCSVFFRALLGRRDKSLIYPIGFPYWQTIVNQLTPDDPDAS